MANMKILPTLRKPLAALLLLCSCEGVVFDSSLPDFPVNFSCSLVQVPYVVITTPNQYFSIQRNTNGSCSGITSTGESFSASKYDYRLGYGGLIVGNSPFNGYCAFDAACPYDYKNERKKVSVELQTDGIGKAICPECGTEYDLNNGGIPVKGDSDERLRPYQTHLSTGIGGNEELIVTN